MAEPLRKLPLQDEEEERLAAVPGGIEPLPPALPGTPPAFDEEEGRRMERERMLEDRASSLGEAMGSAISSLRQRVRSGMRVVAGRSRQAGSELDEMADTAREKAEDFADEAQRRFADWRLEARKQMYRGRLYARRMARENPAQAIGVIAGTAFVVGLMLRIWRSNSD